jgi:hypothetical protein
MALTDPWSGEDDDTGYDYYDTPSGNIRRPGAEPGQPCGDEPGRPDTGPYEVIHLGGQAAVVVPRYRFPAAARAGAQSVRRGAEGRRECRSGACLPFP